MTIVLPEVKSDVMPPNPFWIRRIALGLVGVLTMLTTSIACAASLELLTEDYPPYNMYAADGVKVVGLSTDLLEATLARAGITYRISLVPWQRALKSARENADTCVYSTSRLPERESAYRWIGPLINNDWTLFAPSDSRIAIAQLDDARHLRIGSYYGDAIDDYLKAQGFMVDSADADNLNPRKLLSGRIDLWATGSLLGPYLARQAGLAGKIKPILTFRSSVMYLACNLGVTNALVGQIETALKAVESDGTADTIRRRYLNTEGN